MKKSPESPTVLKLIPSGKKLSDVIDSLAVMNVLLSALLTDAVSVDPRTKDRLLFNLRAIVSFADLAPQFKKAYDRVIKLVESLEVRHP